MNVVGFFNYFSITYHFVFFLNFCYADVLLEKSLDPLPQAANQRINHISAPRSEKIEEYGLPEIDHGIKHAQQVSQKEKNSQPGLK